MIAKSLRNWQKKTYSRWVDLGVGLKLLFFPEDEDISLLNLTLKTRFTDELIVEFDFLRIFALPEQTMQNASELMRNRIDQMFYVYIKIEMNFRVLK